MVAPASALAAQPLRDRLQAVSLSQIDGALQPDAVALLRLIIAEASRFPDLTQQAERIGRNGGVTRIAEVLAAPDHASAIGVERALPLAAKFLDLTLVPHQMRALLGADIAALRAAAPKQIHDAITVMAAAGWLQLE
jgi:AefR-like transcriptional repressor, C-terminal domain